MIESKDISVVVQGGIDPLLTPLCLISIRKHLPDATIILSSWKGTVPAYLDYDILVENEDPGAEYMDTYGIRNNVNRQILSTRNGLQKVTTPYVLKLRSDMEITSTLFLEYFDRFPVYGTKCRFLKKRIVISNFYTASPQKTKFLFHPSDWIAFGLREDVMDLWDIDLAPEPETSAYFRNNKKDFALPDPVPSWKFRYIPEQYICLSFLKKHRDMRFEHYLDYTPENLDIWNAALANNFIVLDYYSQLGLKFMKYNPAVHRIENQMTHLDWLRLYQKYSDNRHRISLLSSCTHFFRKKYRLAYHRLGMYYRHFLKRALTR